MSKENVPTPTYVSSDQLVTSDQLMPAEPDPSNADAFPGFPNDDSIPNIFGESFHVIHYDEVRKLLSRTSRICQHFDKDFLPIEEDEYSKAWARQVVNAFRSSVPSFSKKRNNNSVSIFEKMIKSTMIIAAMLQVDPEPIFYCYAWVDGGSKMTNLPAVPEIWARQGTAISKAYERLRINMGLNGRSDNLPSYNSLMGYVTCLRRCCWIAKHRIRHPTPEETISTVRQQLRDLQSNKQADEWMKLWSRKKLETEDNVHSHSSENLERDLHIATVMLEPQTAALLKATVEKLLVVSKTFSDLKKVLVTAPNIRNVHASHALCIQERTRRLYQFVNAFGYKNSISEETLVEDWNHFLKLMAPNLVLPESPEKKGATEKKRKRDETVSNKEEDVEPQAEAGPKQEEEEDGKPPAGPKQDEEEDGHKSCNSNKKEDVEPKAKAGPKQEEEEDGKLPAGPRQEEEVDGHKSCNSNKKEVIELLGSDSEGDGVVGGGMLLPFSQVDVEYSDHSPLREMSHAEYHRADQNLRTTGPNKKPITDNPFLKLGSLKRLANPPVPFHGPISPYWLTDESVNNYLILLSRRDKKLSQLDPKRGKNFFFKSSFYTWFVPLKGDRCVPGSVCEHHVDDFSPQLKLPNLVILISTK